MKSFLMFMILSVVFISLCSAVYAGDVLVSGGGGQWGYWQSISTTQWVDPQGRPDISGGLGVACYGICQALAPKVDLTIIFPRTENRAKVKGATSIGLDQIDLEKFLTREEIRKIHTSVEKKEFLFSFSPYLTHVAKSIMETSEQLAKVVVKPSHLPDNIFIS